jgi:hypothetical protein
MQNNFAAPDNCHHHQQQDEERALHSWTQSISTVTKICSLSVAQNIFTSTKIFSLSHLGLLKYFHFQKKLGCAAISTFSGVLDAK